MPRGSEEQERLPGELCFHFRHLLFPLISFFCPLCRCNCAQQQFYCSLAVTTIHTHTHMHTHTHTHIQMNSSFTHLQSRSEAGCGLVRSDRRFLHIFFRFFAFWSVFFFVFVSVDFVVSCAAHSLLPLPLLFFSFRAIFFTE